jgi:gamma-glutamyltranspeptidase/glutathione hydrolase
VGKRATRAAIAAGHEATCGAAARVLEAGGNAFDAAVAAGFAASVSEPALTSLGGGGFLLARTAGGRNVLFDFFSDTPGRELPAGELDPHFVPVVVRFPGSKQIFNVGLGSVAVPGTLRGLLHVHARLGRLPLPEVLAPAVALAREGVPLNPHQSYFLDLLTPIMTLTAEGRALFAPEGKLVGEGEALRNPELADFLESLPREGDRDFYEGALAARVARDMREGQGLLTESDLAGYRVVERAPLRARYRSCELLTNPPPSFGGSLLALSLRLLEAAGRLGPSPDAPRSAETLLGVMRATEDLRAGGCLGPGAWELLPEAERRDILSRVAKAGGTTHVSISDAEGNAASMTHSNGEGSGYLVPGTGIMLNNMLGEDDLHPEGFHAHPAGQRVASMMSPSLLLEGGALRLVVGSGGSKRIRTALLQVLTAVVDFDLDLAQAVELPRLHWDGETLQVEPGLPAATREALARQVPVNTWSQRDVYFGGAHAVTPDGTAAGDPRRGGAALSL